MDLGLRDRVALVGGSSRGLGKASALALAQEGAKVTVCARDGEALEATAKEIRERTGGEVLAVAADLSSAEGVEQVVAGTVERFGGLDVLVANSGGPAPGKFGDLDDDAWREGFEVVTLSFVRFVRAALPHMRAGGWGRVVAIQSSSVKEQVPFLDLSNGIRPGVAGIVKALAGRPGRGGDHDQPRAPRDVPDRAHPPRPEGRTRAAGPAAGGGPRAAGPEHPHGAARAPARARAAWWPSSPPSRPPTSPAPPTRWTAARSAATSRSARARSA